MTFNVQSEWVHLQYEETAAFTETYGFAGNQGAVNLEAIRFRPEGHPSDTLMIFMHPASTLQLLPVPRAMAASGAHVLCAASRYAKNDTALIMEKVFLDLGAYIRHAKQVWGYKYVVLVGWSGGGALAVSYQAEAEDPTITHTPAGDPINVKGAGLIPADAVIYQAAHLSRAHLLAEAIDPSVRDELNPDDRDVELDIYDPRNPNQPPYSKEYIARYRAAQLARMRRITAWVKHTLAELKQRNTGELERPFIVHRTLADPRFLDPTLDPNDRKPGWCYMGKPETVNTGPVGLGRFSTLRSWLSQWSLDDSKGNGLEGAKRIRAPLLVIENSADDAAPQTHPKMLFDAAVSPDKTFKVIKGATHYYAGQPELLKEATALIRGWLIQRKLLEVLNPRAAMGPALVIAVVMLATVTQPLGTDLYLTALPAIRNEFAAPVSVVQLTLAVLVFSFGLSQLFWGPAADRFGRRRVLAAGFLLYAGGAGLGVLAPAIEVLIAARVLQGLGIAATMVCSRAIVRDLFEQQHGTHVMSVAMSSLACFTMAIPVAGALLTETLGWRSTLWTMALFGLGGVALVLLRVPETARALEPTALQLRPLFGGYARIARNPAFRSWTLLNSCGYAANFGFFSSSAYLYLETFGVSRVTFGLVIGSASVAYMAGTFLCRHWIARHGIVTSVRRAGYLSLAAAAVFVVPQLAQAHTVLTLTAGLWLMLLAYGIHQPCGHVGMATPFPLQAGAASALGGFIFASAAFLCGTWMGVMYRGGSAAVLALTTGALAAATGLIALTLVQRHGRVPLAQPVTP